MNTVEEYELKKDFYRYSKAHSWYKHLPLSGRDFYVFQTVGEQNIGWSHIPVDDLSGIHWHFKSEIPSHIKTPIYKVTFGPFLRGIEGKYSDANYTSKGCAHGLNIIIDCNKELFGGWIKENYPKWSGINWSNLIHDVEYEVVKEIEYELFETEYEKYWNDLRTTVTTKGIEIEKPI